MSHKGIAGQPACSPRDLLRLLVTAPPGECPYGFSRQARYRYGCFASLPGGFMDFFLAAGFRRNGSCLYTMECPGCTACIPIRLRPAAFKPNRSQQRVQRRNRDITMEVAPLEIDSEKTALCNAFLAARYPDQESSATDYYHGFFLNRLCNTVEFRYLVRDRLIGVGIIDLGTDWLNAVYFYFDPTEKKRSPGIFNILTMIDFCRSHGIENLYLGYWIENCRAMDYKANFRPHQLYRNNRWSDYRAARAGVPLHPPACGHPV